MLTKAFEHATNKHQGQYRKNGEAYIEHPLRVAKKLQIYNLPVEAIAASLLHDVCEETETSPFDISKNFGKETSMMVYFLTKERKDFVSDCSHKRLTMYLEKIRQGVLICPEIVLIKIADQIDNLQSINVFSLRKQKEQIKELKLFINLYSDIFVLIPQKYHQILGILAKELQSEVLKIERELAEMAHGKQMK